MKLPNVTIKNEQAVVKSGAEEYGEALYAQVLRSHSLEQEHPRARKKEEETPDSSSSSFDSDYSPTPRKRVRKSSESSSEKSTPTDDKARSTKDKLKKGEEGFWKCVTFKCSRASTSSQKSIGSSKTTLDLSLAKRFLKVLKPNELALASEPKAQHQIPNLTVHRPPKSVSTFTRFWDPQKSG